jgi:hypothetical protein
MSTRGWRTDLLALTADALAALTNWGLVKRATRAVETGDGPMATVDPDGTVHGVHADGTRTELPVAGLAAAGCTCGASGACRHVVMLVLTYQQQVAAPGPEPASWSPAEFTDQAIEELIGARAMAAARRLRGTGYAARVRRPRRADPVPQVELPSCTVRFLVPHQLGYAHTDAAAGTGTEAVALAVWAYQIADAQAPGQPEVQVEVGGGPQPSGGGPQLAGVSAMDAAVALAGDLLLDGAVHSGPAVAGRLAAVRRDLAASNLCWPLLALDDLREQLDAYRDRSARYRPERLAELLAELPARQRAARHWGGSPRSLVLGTEEAAEVPMRRARFIGLGCRVGGTPQERTAEVFLAHTETATVLVLHRRWPVAADATPPTGAGLARRRVAGTTLATLASGNLVTETAARSASRRLRLASNRVARTTVTRSAGNWRALPDSLLVTDLAALDEALRWLPPRLLRPRVDAESVRVIALGAVRSIRYFAGDQRLDAVVTDPAGGTATISARYHPLCPAALDSVAAALSGEPGPPRFVSGTVRRGRGGLVVTPIAVVAGDQVVVPDLAAGEGDTAFAPDAPPPVDELAAAVGGALSLLAEAAHRGVRHVPASFPERLRAASQALSRVGLRGCARALAALAATLAPNPGTKTVQAWVDAQIRLLVTADNY